MPDYSTPRITNQIEKGCEFRTLYGFPEHLALLTLGDNKRRLLAQPIALAQVV